MSPEWIITAALVSSSITAVSSLLIGLLLTHFIPRKQKRIDSFKDDLESFALLEIRYWTSQQFQPNEKLSLEVEITQSLRRIRTHFRILSSKYRKYTKVRSSILPKIRDLNRESTGGCFECDDWDPSEDRARRCASIANHIVDVLPD